MFSLMRSSWPVVLLLILGCSPKNRNSSLPEPTKPLVDEGAALAREITYYGDIKSLMETRCVNCHQAGGIAPFALTDASAVLRMQKPIIMATQTKAMPPWLASSSCNSYENDRSMKDAEIELLAQWSKQGARLGNPAEYVAPTVLDPGLSRIDREIAPEESYKPKPNTNDYRCFVMDWPETAVKYITGVGVQPGQPNIVHHVIAYRVPPNQIDTVKALDEAEAGPGYTCFGGPIGSGASLPQIAQWAPGSLGRDFPSNTGLKIEPGSKLVMQVHYNTDHGTAEPDQSRLLIKLDDGIEKEAYILPFTNPDWVRNHTMKIPPGKSDVVHSFQAPLTYYASLASGGVILPNAPLKIYSAGLHMHLIGQSISLKLEKKDGAKACLLDIPKWDFHWQSGYVLKEAITVHPGDSMHLECHFNNSEGKKEVNWGEGTEDEMCLGFVYVTGM